MFDDIIRDNLSPQPIKESYNEKLHIIVAEIYNAAQQIQYQADNWDIRDSNSSQYPVICEMVKRIQYLDSLLHDGLFPKEGDPE